MAEKVKVIDIDTGKSAKTLKELRTEIKNLRAELDNCEIGSEQFVDTLNELTEAQDELKKATKTSTDTLEGSYDALVKKMAELKKAWRATADEAERSDLGNQIAEINGQLKELDEGIGNYQRNVGNYGSAFDDVSIKFDNGVAKFERMNKVTQEAVGSFDAVEGSLKAMGIESEVVSGCVEKLNGVMQMTRGFNSIKEGAIAFRALTVATEAQTVATNSATVAANGLKKALITTGIGALVVAVGMLVANWDKIKNLWNDTSPQEKAAAAMRDINHEATKMANETAAKNIVRIKELQREYVSFSDSLDKKKEFVENYKDELEAMGIQMESVNDAEEIFKDRTPEYIEALKKRAKADALREKATENYKKALDIIADAEAEYVDKAKNIVQPDGVIGKIKQIFGMIQIATGTFADDYAQDIAEAKSLMETQFNALWDQIEALEEEADNLMYGDEEARKKREAERKAAEAERKAAEEARKQAAEEARKRAQEEAEATRIAERAKQSLIDTKEEELAELTRIYTEEKKLLEKHKISTTNLTKEYLDKQTELLRETLKVEGAEQEQLAVLEKFYNERLRIYTEYGVSTVELTAQYESEKNAIIQNFETQRQEALRQMSDDSKTQKELEIQSLTEEYNTYLELFKDHKEQLLIVEDWYKQQLAEIDERYANADTSDESPIVDTEAHKQTMAEFIDSYGELYKRIREGAGETAANVAVSFTQALQSASQILSTIQAGIDISEKEGFEQNKKYQYAQAGINMAQGILAAISSAMTIPPPMGVIMGSINAATVATVGAIQMRNIKNQKFGSTTPPDTNVPTVNTNALMSTPINYTTEIKGAQAEEDIADTRVYVVESDISNVQKKVEVAEEEATF